MTNTASGGGGFLYCHLFATGGANILIGAGCASDGSNGALFGCQHGIVTLSATTFTVRNNPTFSRATVTCDTGGVVNAFAGASMSGSATGARFLVEYAGNIRVFGGGLNFFPGTIAGTEDSATYGLYVP